MLYGRTNSLTHPTVKELSVHIYNLVAPGLPAVFKDMIQCETVALAGAAVRSSA
jgi:hypothetical protein